MSTRSTKKKKIPIAWCTVMSYSFRYSHLRRVNLIKCNFVRTRSCSWSNLSMFSFERKNMKETRTINWGLHPDSKRRARPKPQCLSTIIIWFKALLVEKQNNKTYYLRGSKSSWLFFKLISMLKLSFQHFYHRYSRHQLSTKTRNSEQGFWIIFIYWGLERS